jgi:hypothetical protein
MTMMMMALVTRQWMLMRMMMMSKLKIIVYLEYLGLEQKPPIQKSTPSGILFFVLIN